MDPAVDEHEQRSQFQRKVEVSPFFLCVKVYEKGEAV